MNLVRLFSAWYNKCNCRHKIQIITHKGLQLLNWELTKRTQIALGCSSKNIVCMTFPQILQWITLRAIVCESFRVQSKYDSLQWCIYGNHLNRSPLNHFSSGVRFLFLERLSVFLSGIQCFPSGLSPISSDH